MLDEVVSSENESLILVDESDNELGFLSKAECHDGAGVLHRAFSVFIFNANGELLLQQRARTKRLWPSFWSNSCCSHPREGESMQVATQRRLQEELGVQVELQYVYKFRYQAEFGAIGSEHELCSVYLGCCREEIRPNTTEIDAVRYISAGDLRDEIVRGAHNFTPWFRQEWDRLSSQHAVTLGEFINLRNGNTRSQDL